MNSGKRIILPAAALALVLFSVPLTVMASDRGDRAPGAAFHDLKSQTEVFISYSRDISLAPEEVSIRDNALSSIPAPCCDSYSAATCCCVCNLARSIWGLSNYLIHEEGYSAGHVTESVMEWLSFTNPKGFSGNACFNGGCGRPFYRDGCGGMEEGKLII